MKIVADQFVLFEDISSFNFGRCYYDFHNDFNCIKILLEEESLYLYFQHMHEKYVIILQFYNCEIEKLNFEGDFTASLTIDTIYRGRYEKSGLLKEFSDDGKAYFYIEFYEGNVNIELLCSGILLQQQ